MRPALLIPIKTLGNAKQRLGDAFDQQHRTLLAQAMLHDVLTAVTGLRELVDVYLVTGDETARSLASEFHFGVIPDDRNESESAAIEMATAWCEARGYDTTIVIPADVPLVTSDELRRALDAAPDVGMVIVPAYDRRGSNCILRRPASIIPLRFGNDSFLPHCAAMRQTGKPLIILELPGISLDIDHPHELEMLRRLRGDTCSQRLLRAWDLETRSAAALEAAG